MRERVDKFIEQQAACLFFWSRLPSRDELVVDS